MFKIKHLFISNKISLGQINISLNQINFSSKQTVYFIIAFVYGQRYNLFDLRQKLICFEQIFSWFKDTLLELNKFYLFQINHIFKSKRVLQTNYFFQLNQIFFLSVYYFQTFHRIWSVFLVFI